MWRWFVRARPKGDGWQVVGFYARYSPTITYGFDCWNFAMKFALDLSGLPSNGPFSGCPTHGEEIL